jgi:sterol desaturase/sphingolipid hydroxylase (fatty acid hydroxylase superfamily)
MNIYIKILFYFLYSSSIIINKTNSFILPQIFREWTPIAIESKIDRTKPFSFIVGNHHLLHHKQPKCNFSEYYIDYLFGTLHENTENTNEM